MMRQLTISPLQNENRSNYINIGNTNIDTLLDDHHAKDPKEWDSTLRSDSSEEKTISTGFIRRPVTIQKFLLIYIPHVTPQNKLRKQPQILIYGSNQRNTQNHTDRTIIVNHLTIVLKQWDNRTIKSYARNLQCQKTTRNHKEYSD